MIRRSPHNAASKTWEAPESFRDAGRNFDWLTASDTGQPIGYVPPRGFVAMNEQFPQPTPQWAQDGPAVPLATLAPTPQARAVAGGLQAHSVGGPYPFLPVGIANGDDLVFEVWNLQTGAKLHWFEDTKVWQGALRDANNMASALRESEWANLHNDMR